MGFCIYNNVLVGVAHAQARHAVRRVAIPDFDIHHGNGDAQIAQVRQTQGAAVYGQTDGRTDGRTDTHTHLYVYMQPGGSGAALCFVPRGDETRLP